MGDRLKSIGMHIARYGLAIVLLWIGGMMFTAYQAEGIRPLVANSPLMSWVYRVMSTGGFSSLLGVVEIAIGVLIALRPVWPMGAAVGSGLAAGMFLTTLSFLVTTPGWEPSLGGFPALSAMPGQSLLKDVVLLGVALSSAGEALEAVRRRDALVAATTQGQFTTTRDEGKLTGVYGTGSPWRDRTGSHPSAIRPPQEATSGREPRSLPDQRS
jgi:uncharacterized membrane protein YkgB